MEEIKLPKSQIMSATIDLNNIDYENAEDRGDGTKLVHLGTIMCEDFTEEIKKAEINGGEILYATTSLEQQLEDILLEYFMGSSIKADTKRSLFEREILQSTVLSFANKKDLVFEVIQSNDLLKGKPKSKIQSYLKKIMEWRNAFAHGKIQHDSQKGCFISYYTNAPKTLLINDSFLGEVTNAFKESVKILSEVLSKLKKRK